MGKIIEGYWDCDQCGAKGIKGRNLACPSCGRDRDENIVFYMKEKNVYATKDVVEKLGKEPDWLCSYCKGLNLDSENTCNSCGASKESSEANYFENKRKKEAEKLEKELYEQKVTTNTDYMFRGASVEQDFSPNTKNESTKSQPSIVLDCIKGGVFILAFVAMIVGIFFAFAPKKDTLTVKSVDWVYTIQIEESKVVAESDWTLPYGARLTNSINEFYKYDHVIDHYETKSRQVSKQRVSGSEPYVSGHKDLGNGLFEEITSYRDTYENYTETEYYQDPVYRDDPIYKIKYYYDIDKWFYARSIKTSGSDKNTVWGVTELGIKERVSSETEVYSIKVINSKEENKEYKLNFTDWSDLNVGDVLNVKIHIGDTIEILN